MAFKALFMGYAPDADMAKHHTVIDTGMYRLNVAIVRNQAEALEVCRKLLSSESLDVVHLCPGFSHEDVARIAEAVGDSVAVGVSRGDFRSTTAIQGAVAREGWPS
jgi:hypothetical protein